MDNRSEIYHHSQIALQQIEELSKTLDKLSTLVDHRSFPDDAINDSKINLYLMRTRIGVVSDINQSLTI
jgi:hypothetical protein